MKFIRLGELAKQIVVTDGLPGSGKTMLSPIISSLSRVEMYYFGFEIEFFIRMFHFKKIEKDAAISLIRMLTDYKLYNSMMSREVNFRDLDLSSVTRHHNYKDYLNRSKSPGDKLVPKMIKLKRPILHLASHDLVNYSKVLLEALYPRLTYIEVVRHPIDMVNQQRLNMVDHYNNPRSIQVEFEYKNKPLPYWSSHWKEYFYKNNNVNRAIYNIYNMYKQNIKNRKILKKKLKKNYFCIPFEKFVISPEEYLKKISKVLKIKITKATIKELKNQKIPKKNFFNTPQTKLYRRAGGSLKHIGDREGDINRKIKMFKAKGATKKNLNLLFEISKHYEKFFL